ncbi:MAG: shikimate kinase [Marinilabiliaceae bacterium]
MVDRVFLIGYMGSGKTTIGRYVAKDLGWRFIDMDDYVESRIGCTISDYFARHGEAAFRKAEAEAVRCLVKEEKAVIATGGGSPCFEGNMDVMRRGGLTIYIEVSPANLAKRLMPARAKRPILADKTDEELEAFIAAQLKAREPFYRRAAMVVDGEALPFSAYKMFIEAFEPERRAALFDLDGVVLDTESQYDIIWGRIGKIYHPEIPDFNKRIKGMTLTHIFDTYFAADEALQAKVGEMLWKFEADEMKYEFTPGAKEFIGSLRGAGIKTAIVTSSDESKMRNVRRAMPGLYDLFDAVVTAELTTRSKPAPDGYLKGAELLGASPAECVVFEDSQNGLKAGRAAKMYTVGLATTFPRDVIAPMADDVIENFAHADISRFF